MYSVTKRSGCLLVQLQLAKFLSSPDDNRMRGGGNKQGQDACPLKYDQTSDILRLSGSSSQAMFRYTVHDRSLHADRRRRNYVTALCLYY